VDRKRKTAPGVSQSQPHFPDEVRAELDQDRLTRRADFPAVLKQRGQRPPCLVCVSVFGKTRVVRMTRLLTIGSGSGADLRVADSTVSKLHCLICQHRPEPIKRTGHDGWFLYDMDAKNGTWLNGERIIKPTHLWQGDCIQIGRIHFFLVFLTDCPSISARTSEV
jgi:hypothetical protein